MVTLLAKIFIKDSEDKIKQREAYGMLCGVIGILFNVLLFIGKFLAGTLSNSIAITADAFNNLSDAGSSIVTLLGFKLAGANRIRSIHLDMEGLSMFPAWLWLRQSF